MNKDTQLLQEAYKKVRDSKMPDYSRYGSYDHIHWTRINDNPLDADMGTLSDDDTSNDGLVALLGRARDGRHYTLFGPVTKEEYFRIKKIQGR